MEQLARGYPWQVLIVEDDPVIAAIYRKTIATTDGLNVAGTVARGEDALAFVQHRECDLMLLDLRLAGLNGVNVLHKLRGDGHPVEVIALTATRSASVVQTVIQRGAIDYLVKPFTIERLRRSLRLFVNRAGALQNDQLDQDAVDVVCSSGRLERRWLPKGLTPEGVARVRRVLVGSTQPLSATDVSTLAGLARVTARRYLEYLVSVDEASVDAAPSGPGRPSKLYRLTFETGPGSRTMPPDAGRTNARPAASAA